MLALWATPEIDGVRRSFERVNSEYGDNLSDCYWNMIDVATDPRVDFESKQRRVIRALEKLSFEESFIELSLREDGEFYDVPDLLERYRSVLSQVKELIGIEMPRQQG